MEFDGGDLDDFVGLDDAGFDDVSEPIDAKRDKITTEPDEEATDEEATDEESTDEENKGKSFVLATEPVVGIFGSLDELMLGRGPLRGPTASRRESGGRGRMGGGDVANGMPTGYP
jgi:hypothetical protein